MKKGKLWPSANQKPVNRSSPNSNGVIASWTPTTKKLGSIRPEVFAPHIGKIYTVPVRNLLRFTNNKVLLFYFEPLKFNINLATHVYDNAVAFWPRDFPANKILTPQLSPNRTYGAGWPHVGLYPKFLVCFVFLLFHWLGAYIFCHPSAEMLFFIRLPHVNIVTFRPITHYRPWNPTYVKTALTVCPVKHYNVFIFCLPKIAASD